MCNAPTSHPDPNTPSKGCRRCHVYKDSASNTCSPRERSPLLQVQESLFAEPHPASARFRTASRIDIVSNSPLHQLPAPLRPGPFHPPLRSLAPPQTGSPSNCRLHRPGGPTGIHASPPESVDNSSCSSPPPIRHNSPPSDRRPCNKHWSACSYSSLVGFQRTSRRSRYSRTKNMECSSDCPGCWPK